MTKRIFVDDWKVKFQIWDTAGQERFRSMTPMYYRAASAAILVYDITSQDSFEAVKEWVQELKTNVEDDIVISIAGHKVDLEHARQVNRLQAAEFASKIGAVLYETSALSNNGIEELFDHMARNLIEKQKRIEQNPATKDTFYRGVDLTDPAPSQQQRKTSTCC